MHNDLLLLQYLPIAIFCAIAGVLGLIISALPFVLAKRAPYPAKNQAYECGFPSFSEPRRTFDVKFYLVSVMFILFDLEIAFLVPWSIVLKKIGTPGFISMMVFLAVAAVGFLYEMAKGAIDW